MQLVIDMPDDMYENIRSERDLVISMNRPRSNGKTYIQMLMSALKKGVVLPKHGRLIDADLLYQKCLDIQGKKKARYFDIDDVMQTIKKQSPTVLEGNNDADNS